MMGQGDIRTWSALLGLPLALGLSALILYGGSSIWGLILLLIVVFLVIGVKWGRGHLLAGLAFFLLAVSLALAWVRNDLSYLAVSLLCILVGATLVAHRSGMTLAVFSPFMLAVSGFLVLFALKGLMLLWEDEISGWAVSEALWYANLGFAMFYCGYSLKVGKVFNLRWALLGQDWTPGRIRWAFRICAGLGVVCFWGLMQLSGVSSYRETLSDLMAFRLRSSSAGLAYVLFGMQSLLHVAAFLLFVEVLRKPRYPLLAWFRFLVFCAFVSAVFWPFALRGMFMVFAGGLAVAFNYLKRPIKAREFLVGAVILGAFIAGYSRYRDSGIRWQTTGQALEDLRDLNVVESVMNRFDALDKFAMSLEELHYASLQGNPSSFFVGIFLRPVPRAFMPSKRLETGSEMTSLLFPDVHESNVNFEYSIMGEMYFYFSVFGIVIGMMVYGFLVRILQEYFERNYLRQDFQLHYSLIAFTPVSWLLAGFNSGATITLVYFSVIAWLVLKFLNVGKPRNLMPATPARSLSPSQVR